MRTSTLSKNGISPEVSELILRLVASIPWPARRKAMGDVALTILDGKPRVAEKEFGWSRSGVAVGIKEFQGGIVCVNDLSERHRPKSEEKNPRLIEDIRRIMEPCSQAEPRLRSSFRYTDMTAQSVYNALLDEGWTEETLPTVRTISDILNRHGYRLRSASKSRAEKKRKIQEPSTIMASR